MKATRMARVHRTLMPTVFVLAMALLSAQVRAESCDAVADHLVAQSSHLVIAKIVMPECARKNLEQGSMLISKSREEWMALCAADMDAQVALVGDRDRILKRCRLRGSGIAWD